MHHLGSIAPLRVGGYIRIQAAVSREGCSKIQFVFFLSHCTAYHCADHHLWSAIYLARECRASPDGRIDFNGFDHK